MGNREPLQRYIVTYYNRISQCDSTFFVLAENAFRAGRLFYRRYERKVFFDCITSIVNVDTAHFWTESEINKTM